MKLAYVTALFPFAHAEQFFEAEVRSLAQRVPVVLIATRPPSSTVRYANLGADALYLPLFGARVFALALREALRSPWRALALFGAVAFGRSSIRARAVNLASFPKALATAHELRRLGIEHVHAAWLTTPATIAWVASRLTGIPFSITAHQHDIFSRNLLAAKIRAARFTRVISDRNRSALVAQLPPELATRCVTAHLGVAVPPEVVIPAARTPRILCAARLCSWKGHRYLLEALGLLRDRGIDFTCDLAGGGELRAEVAQAIERLALGDRVRMLGNVPHPDVVAALDRGDYDLFALASTEREGEHEGIPVAAMEAMAAGVPVVSTMTGSLPELVGSGEGILVPQRDPVALAAALETLLGDPAARRVAGDRARHRIVTSFETTATTAALLDLIAGRSAGPNSS
ncbi:MAG TPA: glycosyltransferase [Candidatus Elarobacter sp.]|jgi:glycosyltransferase involved in cell wall biosynthesis